MVKVTAAVAHHMAAMVVVAHVMVPATVPAHVVVMALHTHVDDLRGSRHGAREDGAADAAPATPNDASTARASRDFLMAFPRCLMFRTGRGGQCVRA